MGLLHNKDGRYSKVVEVSDNPENGTLSCRLRTYKNLTERINETDEFEESLLMWKGTDYPSEENKLSAIYNICTTNLDCALYPDLDEDDCPKIYQHIKRETKAKHFHNIDYVVEMGSNLYPKRTMVRGEVQRVEWFSDEACTDKVLIVDITYTRDYFGFATMRETTRTWLNRDDTENIDKKVTNKNYTINKIEQVTEGIRRRGNIITGLQMPILGMMMATITTGYTQPEVLQMGRDFLKTHKLAMQSFIDESHKQVQTDITNATDFWLDNYIDGNGTTIRMYILNEMNI